MNAPELPAPACRHCAGAMVAGTRFCPHCGRSEARRRYRGPVVLGVVGLLLAAVGAAVGTATFSTMSADGFSGEIADLAGPAVNDILRSTGTSEIELLENGGGASTAMVLAFVGSIVLGVLGAFLLCVALAWALVRAQAGRRAGAAHARRGPPATSGRERAQQGVERARPHVERAVERTRTEVVPKVADGARRGRDAVNDALERRRQRRG